MERQRQNLKEGQIDQEGFGTFGQLLGWHIMMRDHAVEEQ